jgi:hypothetical protein
MPTGRPSAVRPTGAAVAGRWANVAGAIHWKRCAYGIGVPFTWIVRAGNGSL